jgi:hypothetical protein
LALRAQPLARARLWSCITLKRFTPGISNFDAAIAHVRAWRAVGDHRRLFEALGDLAEFQAAIGRCGDAESTLAEMRSIEDPGWPAHVRLGYHWPATHAAELGGDMALLGARLDDQERAAVQVHSFRTSVVSSWQRVAWAVGIGDLRLAIELGLVAIQKADAFGSPGAKAAARSSYVASALLSGPFAGAPAMLRECLAHGAREGFVGHILDTCALYAVRTNHAEHAARMLGCADAAFAAVPSLRGALELKVVATFIAQTTHSLGMQELARLRAEGSRCTAAQTLALAEALLAD